MSPREATRYLLWYGAKEVAGDSPTEEEFQKFKEAREISKGLAKMFMRLKESDYEYTPGRPFS